jgi:hypothetical protein
MRIPISAHTSQPWQIHEIAPDFEIEDVWALPAWGEAEDFPTMLEVFTSLDFPDDAPLPVRALWGLRELLGRWLGLDRNSTPPDATDDAENALAIPGTRETTLLERVPDDLRGTAAVSIAPDKPFRALYRTDREYAAELSNRTVHGVLHLGWVEQDDGRYRGQMAVLVKSRGRFGQAYMAFIKPFRHALVYPALLRVADRAWQRRDILAAKGVAAT